MEDDPAALLAQVLGLVIVLGRAEDHHELVVLDLPHAVNGHGEALGQGVEKHVHAVAVVKPADGIPRHGDGVIPGGVRHQFADDVVRRGGVGLGKGLQVTGA